MSLVNKLKRLAGLPDISQKKIREFLSSVPAERPLCRDSGVPTSLALIVPCYGHAQFIETMLTSIRSQTRYPDEVFFIDDCSPDDTRSILEGFSAEQKNCTLLRNDRNLGQSASLNLAIGAAKSDLIMILNDDDYLCHDTVETMFSLFEQFRDVCLIGGLSIHFNSDEVLQERNKNISQYADITNLKLTVYNPSDVLHYSSYNDLNMTHSGSCFLKCAWEHVGGYVTEKRRRLVPFSDRDFQLRVNALFPVAVSSDFPFSFWRSNSSVDQGRDS